MRLVICEIISLEVAVQILDTVSQSLQRRDSKHTSNDRLAAMNKSSINVNLGFVNIGLIKLAPVSISICLKMLDQKTGDEKKINFINFLINKVNLIPKNHF